LVDAVTGADVRPLVKAAFLVHYLFPQIYRPTAMAAIE
jgi:hypothetical protein